MNKNLAFVILYPRNLIQNSWINLRINYSCKIRKIRLPYSLIMLDPSISRTRISRSIWLRLRLGMTRFINSHHTVYVTTWRPPCRTFRMSNAWANFLLFPYTAALISFWQKHHFHSICKIPDKCRDLNCSCYQLTMIIEIYTDLLYTEVSSQTRLSLSIICIMYC